MGTPFAWLHDTPHGIERPQCTPLAFCRLPGWMHFHAYLCSRMIRRACVGDHVPHGNSQLMWVKRTAVLIRALWLDHTVGPSASGSVQRPIALVCTTTDFVLEIT